MLTQAQADALAEELGEVQHEMNEQLQRAKDIMKRAGGGVEARAQAYWLAWLDTMINGGKHETTMQSAIDELEEDGKEDFDAEHYPTTEEIDAQLDSETTSKLVQRETMDGHPDATGCIEWRADEPSADALTRHPAFTREGVEYYAWKESGVFVGIASRGSRLQSVLAIPMGDDGEPTNDGVIEVTNLDDDAQALVQLNAILGTSFSMSHFPGR